MGTGTDLASRLRAKFSKRRHSHSAAPSLASNPSGTDTWSLRSNQGENNDRDRSSSLRTASRARGTTPLAPSQSRDDDNGAVNRQDFALNDEEESQGRTKPPNGHGREVKAQSEHHLSITAEADVSSTSDKVKVPGSSLATTAPAPEPQPPVTVPPPPPIITETPASPEGEPLPPKPASITATDEHQNYSRVLLSSTSDPPRTSSDLHRSSQLEPSSPSSSFSHLHPLTSTLDSIHEDSSPDRSPPPVVPSDDTDGGRNLLTLNLANVNTTVATPAVTTPTASTPRPPGPPRRQSLLSNRQSTLIKTLLHNPAANEYGGEASVLPIDAEMVIRKVWVRRPHASPTLITINEDDLVDDVRDMILRKYSNSLGRTFDSPDLNIRICPRDQQKDRLLGPEEPMGRTLDAYFPGGQTVEEALIIDIPRRAPKASPRPVQPYGNPVYYYEDGRPSEAGEGYFPPVGGVPSPHLPVTVPAQTNVTGPHSIAVLGTGHLPPIPSPGGTRSRAYRERPDRPRLGRTHTSSPTIIANGPTGSIAAAANHGTQHFNPRAPRSRTHSNSSEAPTMPPAPPLIPTPPAPETQRADTPPPPARISSPRPSQSRPKKSKKAEHPNLPPGMLNGGVPPINVLIVEDNPINLKLLEAFVKRLKVRWQTAMNGRDAVKKWRTGGFHLVLMDIQLPIMNGLDATREIRRLEKVNSIGVFSSSATGEPEEVTGDVDEADKLQNLLLFKSPVIIVALTASSLQSDRHQALAAGCNDFLTKVRYEISLRSIRLLTNPSPSTLSG